MDDLLRRISFDRDVLCGKRVIIGGGIWLD